MPVDERAVSQVRQVSRTDSRVELDDKVKVKEIEIPITL
jgi:hypothetical protein